MGSQPSSRKGSDCVHTLHSPAVTRALPVCATTHVFSATPTISSVIANTCVTRPMYAVCGSGGVPAPPNIRSDKFSCVVVFGCRQ
jgi:hypothetical protein